MSYDIRWCVETKFPNVWGESFAAVHTPHFDSPTYNYGPMFRACMDWDYRQIGGDLRAVYYPIMEVLPKLKRGLAQLTEHPEKYRKYEPENGWGSLVGAKKCLSSWIDELEDQFGVAYTWPIDRLWWRW